MTVSPRIFFAANIARAVWTTLMARRRGQALAADWPWPTETVARAVQGVTAQLAALSLPEGRAFLDRALPTIPAPRGLQRRRATLAGRPTVVWTPRGWQPGTATVLYLHGGGYVIGSPHTVQPVLQQLARRIPARVIALDYRLAPESPFPAALDDATAAVAELAREVEPRRLALAGDSAGGGLTLATLLRLRDRGGPRVAAAALICPWLDLTLSHPSVTANAACDFDPDLRLVRRWADAYAATADRRDPALSPLWGNHGDLPPLCVHVGGREMLRDEGRALADRARASGVDVTLYEDPLMIHDWHNYLGVVPNANAALDHMAGWLRDRIQ